MCHHHTISPHMYSIYINICCNNGGLSLSLSFSTSLLLNILDYTTIIIIHHHHHHHNTIIIISSHTTQSGFNVSTFQHLLTKKKRTQIVKYKTMMRHRIIAQIIRRRRHHHHFFFSTDSSSSLLTLAAKAGFDPEQHPDLSPPLRMSTTFDRTSETSSLIYGRTENPTRSLLEKVCCDLEGGSEAIVFSSGIAAISSVFSQFSNVELPRDVYHGTRSVRGVRARSARISLSLPASLITFFTSFTSTSYSKRHNPASLTLQSSLSLQLTTFRTITVLHSVTHNNKSTRKYSNINTLEHRYFLL